MSKGGAGLIERQRASDWTATFWLVVVAAIGVAGLASYLVPDLPGLWATVLWTAVAFVPVGVGATAAVWTLAGVGRRGSHPVARAVAATVLAGAVGWFAALVAMRAVEQVLAGVVS